MECWRQDYNEQRPHSALAYRTPYESAALFVSPPAGSQQAHNQERGVVNQS
jgi:hypothetical protein